MINATSLTVPTSETTQPCTRPPLALGAAGRAVATDRHHALTVRRLALGIAAMAMACSRPEPSANVRPSAGSRDGGAAATDRDGPGRTPPARDGAVDAPYVPPRPPGPTGTIEGTVTIEGEIRPNPPITLTAAWRDRPGCRDAALRYGSPFDISSAGPFPGALVAAEALESGLPTPRDRRIVFRNCDIVPRFIVAHERDRIVFHSDASGPVLPNIVGGGQTINQLLFPGRDQERRTQGPGRYPIVVNTLPEWVQSVLFVLPNRFVDQADSTGHYRITDVPVGNVTVHAWYPGTIESRRVVAVVAGQVAHSDFALRQSPPAPTPAALPADASVPP